MKTSIVCASLLVVAAFGALVPTASANVSQCAAGTCVNTYSYDYGTCGNSGYNFQYRSIRASTDAGGGYHGVGAGNSCYNYDFGSFSGKGSNLYVYEYGYSGSNWQSLSLNWYAYSYSWGGETYSHCDTSIYSYNTPGVPNGPTSLGCPTGDGPGLLIPALP